MSVLDKITSPNEVKKLNNEECLVLAQEIRDLIMTTVKANGGHLSSNLGIVDTTIALCRVFDFSVDKLLFDVGHQCYPYKILTGRKDNFKSIRKTDGISGFPDREESEYDSFIAGHAGNSLGASLGKCFARDKNNQDYYVIDIVGDASLSNGLNLEALSAQREKPKKLIVILNDNGMSIAKNTSGFYQFLSNATIGEHYVKSKGVVRKIFGNSLFARFLRRIKNFFKRLFKFSNIFEAFGFKYVGVYDGNDIKLMTKLLYKVKKYAENDAVLIHIKTKKGKGFSEAESHADSYHGVGKNMQVSNGVFSKCVGETINELIKENSKVIAITAGMASGTGLDAVQNKNPQNFFDVGIAEEYAVNFAAGMASEGIKPVVCIYSTFIQRAYDEILHDVCIQNLPVVFCLDRAGLVGYDGKTHQGVFDISLLSHIPNITIYAPKNTNELKQMLKCALSKNSPIVIRYPNENDICPDEDVFDEKWQKDGEGDITILAVGPRMNALAKTIKEKSNKNISVINARVIKPLDENILNSINGDIITLEEGSLISGFNTLIKDYFISKNKTVRIKSYGVPDEFIKNADISYQLQKCGISEKEILDYIESL